MKALARDKDSCVLATISGSKPYCSLMAYVTNTDCTEIYMVTLRQTQKFQNLNANPAASLLIDTRDMSPRSTTRAMTVEGVYQRIKDLGKEKRVRRKLESAHPHLKQFMGQPGAEIIRIKIKSFLLLNGLTQASFEDVSDSAT
jgi:nitroimidazol reductase NimA-like FMN-containing flavoprotein (pyridoxamine 5'-phosphate oxidase superfamily)